MIVKICGMRQAQNIREAETLRPSMMGFICWDGSPRNVIAPPAYLPSCTRVGVFVEPRPDFVQTKVRELGLGRIQLHGNESPALCREIAAATQLPVVKAISVRRAEDIGLYRRYADIADMLLFDTKCPGVGGSGHSFDWDILQHYDGPLPFLLAGGIGPGDAERVRKFRHPRFAGVDLNSCFETSAACKDIALLKQFINALKR